MSKIISYGEYMLRLSPPGALRLTQARELRILAVNRSPDEAIELELAADGFPEPKLAEHLVLRSEDLSAVNTADQPYHVRPETLPVTDGVVLPPRSWNVFRFRVPEVL